MTTSDAIMGYEMLGMLGYGARSTIYAVKDQNNHVYALKRVVRATPDDQRFIDQAINEHDVATKLNHPNIRKSYKLLRQREFLRVKEIYVLMEMVDGYDMETHKPKTIRALCLVCHKVALALQDMHKQGYAHADMKPKNIIVTDSNDVKIIDFGQSCRIGTVKDRIQGTPDYIAPEQVKLRPITARTDVFNFGASMYWLLTGKNIPTMIAAALGDAMMAVKPQTFPAPRELNPKIPPALSALIMDCVRVQPEDRPANMEMVLSRLSYALNQLENDPVSLIPPKPPPPQRPGSSVSQPSGAPKSN